MVFGEIVEPSSRALWEDDFADYSEAEEPELEWSNNVDVPKIVNNLYIGETPRVVQLLQKCVLEPTKPLCVLTKIGVQLYKVENDSYVITYKSEPDIIVGKIAEKLGTWLKVAKNIYTLTSGSITLLQNCPDVTTSPCIIRSLSSKKLQTNQYPQLEIPNLVTGLSASILTYCIHTNRNCTLYASYFEEVALDSLNSQPFLDLLRHLEISPLRGYVLKEKPTLNNLYM